MSVPTLPVQILRQRSQEQYAESLIVAFQDDETVGAQALLQQILNLAKCGHLRPGDAAGVGVSLRCARPWQSWREPTVSWPREPEGRLRAGTEREVLTRVCMFSHRRAVSAPISSFGNAVYEQASTTGAARISDYGYADSTAVQDCAGAALVTTHLPARAGASCGDKRAIRN